MWPFTKKQPERVVALDEIRRQVVADVAAEFERQGMLSGRVADGLQNFMSGLGTERDKRMYSSYTSVRPLSYAELENMWRANWLAKNIVEGRGNDMVREWWSCQWDGSDEDTVRQGRLDEAEKALGVRQKVQDAVNWGRLYGGAALLMLVNDGKPLSEPLEVESLKAGCLQGLLVYDRWQLGANDLMDRREDILSPNWCKPQYFMLGGGQGDTGEQVHWSRVLLFHGRRLPYRAWLQNGMWHDSELQHVIEEVKDYNAVMACLATMFFEANVDVMMVDKLAATLSLPGGDAKLAKRYDLAFTQKSATRMLMLDAQDRYEKKGNNFTGLGAIVMDFRTNVCAASRTPALVLFGESPGGLNATGDSEMKTYHKSVKQDQEQQLRPTLDRFYQVFLRHVLGEVPPGFKYTFNSLDEENKGEKSGRELQDEQRDVGYITAGVLTPEMVARELRERGTYRMQEDEDVPGKETEEGAAPAPTPTDTQGQAQSATLSLTPTMQGALVTVNEARAKMGMPAWPNADGELTVTEFMAKHSTPIEAAVQAEAGGPKPAPVIAAPKAPPETIPPSK